MKVLIPTSQPSAPPPQRQSDPPTSYSSRQGPPQALGAAQSPHQTHMSQPFNQGPPPALQQHERSFSQGPPVQQYNSPMGSSMNNSMGGQPRAPSQGAPYNTSSIVSNGPPQLSTLPFQTTQAPQPSFSQPQQQAIPTSYSQPPSLGAVAANLPPLKPVFGLSLDQLFERDGSAVPMVVYQCIQAVDLFGLEVEGIYRLSGTQSHVNKIKAMFDNGKWIVYVAKKTLTSCRCIESRLPRSCKFLPRCQ
jgi:Rho GTPase-activating protein RGD1